jgi:hypothetical protein
MRCLAPAGNAMRPLKRLRRDRSHAGHFRTLHTLTPIGFTPRPDGIPSPYMFSASWTVYRDPEGRRVILAETSHRCYDLFDASPLPWYFTEAEAEAEYSATHYRSNA